MKRRERIIFILLFISFMSIGYARYKSTRTETINVSLASWDVSLNGGDNLTIITGNNGTSYDLTVRNNSEVNVSYSVYLTNIPTGVSVKLDNSEYVGENNHRIVFSNVGTLSVNGTRVHTLNFKALLDSEEITNSSIGIDVEFKQN